MKIYAIEVQTELGRRMVKLDVPLDVEARGDMPPQFRSLTDLLWGLVREMALQKPSPTTPSAEA